MAKYLVLYRSSVDAMQQMSSATPEQAQEGMLMWLDWASKAGSALADLGAPLAPAGRVPSGANGDSGLPIAGFSVLEADSVEAATGLLQGHPHLHAPGAVIEVLEYLPVPGA